MNVLLLLKLKNQIENETNQFDCSIFQENQNS